jgi:hypothetical protein
MDKGLYGKYIITKANGEPIADDAKYFVLRYDRAAADGQAARLALLAYTCLVHNPVLAGQLLEALRQGAKKGGEDGKEE